MNNVDEIAKGCGVEGNDSAISADFAGEIAKERGTASEHSAMSADFADEIAKECGVFVRHGVNAYELSTFKGGGKIENLFLPSTIEAFVKILSALADRGQKPFILGGGSNTIFADGTVQRAVVSTAKLDEISVEHGRVCKNKADCGNRHGNVYVDDNGEFEDKAECNNAKDNEYVADGYIYAECGARVQDLISVARENGLCGFEFLSGVPATVGGILRMNAAAFGHETADKVVEMYTLSADAATIEKIPHSELGFSYRHGTAETVVAAVFQLEAMHNTAGSKFADYNNNEKQKIGAQEAETQDFKTQNTDAQDNIIQDTDVQYADFSGHGARDDVSYTQDVSYERTRNYLAQRAYKQPKFPSVGSVFKNPTFDGAKPAAMYIEQAGLKGRRCGGAEISEKHANFIVNRGGACANDFITLVELAESAVPEKFGVALEREFVYVK